MKRAIIIMAKVPRAGNVKTRLQPFLTPAQSEKLAEVFLNDTLAKARKVSEKVIVAFSPKDELNYFDRFFDKSLILIEQKGENLGERMCNAFEFAFSQNADAVVMIGTDSPTFPHTFIENAFEKLATFDSVFGKAQDGGFYLIGLRKLEKEVFQNVAWSSSETFAQTRRNILNLNFSLSEISDWFDVDEPQDLIRLIGELENNIEAQNIAPNTFEFVKRMNETL